MYFGTIIKIKHSNDHEVKTPSVVVCVFCWFHWNVFGDKIVLIVFNYILFIFFKNILTLSYFFDSHFFYPGH